MGTRIFEIDSEIAEILEDKVGTRHFEIYILLLQRQKNNLYVKVGNFDLNYLSLFLIDFQNSCAYHVANFLNFSKLPQLLHVG